jgi:type II secretory pathway component PulC
VLRAVTPEERLLRLIESGEKGGGRLAFGDVRAWAPFFFPYKERARRLVASWFSGRLVPRELDLKLINRGLIVLLVLVVAAIALNAQRVRPSALDFSREARATSLAVKEAQPLATLRPVEDYLKEVEQRDLFNPVAPSAPKKAEAKAEPVKPPEATKPPEPTPLEVLRERAKSLKLVGISWGPVPVAMIEDTAKHETSFLKERESINQIRIKAILRDRVVLSYGNAEYDLF